MLNYVVAFREFWANNKQLQQGFPGGWSIDLIADGVQLSKSANHESWKSITKNGEVELVSWSDFLTRTEDAHREFLAISQAAEDGSV